ncbi:MAG: hypothetical protein J6B26_02795 [Agathobacter sp.]|nr:hypothetical protein [Agathobacter sp.]
MAKNEKVIKYRRPKNFNIGVIIFTIIIIYVIFNIISYFSSSSIAEYEVQQGTIATNYVYKGFVLRDEQVRYSSTDGYLNYYVKNGGRVAYNDIICSVDLQGNISSQIAESSKEDIALSKSDLKEISEEIDGFSTSYGGSDFSNVYTFKNDLSSKLTQTLNSNALSQLSSQVTEAVNNNTFIKVCSEAPGIVAYYVDGYEGTTWENFKSEYLSSLEYSKTNLDSRDQIQSNAPLYKLITDEEWSIVIAISPELAEKYAEDSYIKIRFCKDDYITNAAISIDKKDGQYYMILTLKKAMIRYFNERYLDIELVISEDTGLKIPNSAITTKEFFAVPKEYFTSGSDSSDRGIILKDLKDAEGDPSFINPTIYYETETAYFIDSESVSSGDIIIAPDSQSTYTIGTDIEELQGVYNINKGYAVFKQINIMYQNEEYAIVEMKTAYGLALYDHIALEGSKVQENQFTTK